MIKVYTNKKVIDGIARVVEAQRRYLPQFGIQITDNIREADIICNHGAALETRQGVPMVHIGHGLYWSRQKWGDDFMEVNKAVVESMVCSVAQTVPSDWVNTAVRRGGYFYPETVYHGVAPEDFQPSTDNKGYVLWNKARADFVSDPMDMMRVSQRLMHRQFLTTIGKKTDNVTVMGPVPYQQMKQVVAEAGVYLATTRETFGVGTLEAMACGIPVAGFDWGGQHEIIIPGVTGYLAPPGDFAGLAECIELCYANRETLSKNAMEDIRERWTWQPRIEQYANIFKRVYDRYCDTQNKPKVSVIVTAYHLNDFLPKCLDSIKEQTFRDFECIVVDDAQDPETKRLVEHYAKSDSRIRYYSTPKNMGLPGARNFGLSVSKGNLVRHIDADDYLAATALELEVSALDKDPSIHIVYGHLEVTRTDGSRVMDPYDQPIRGGWPEDKFNWYKQMAHLNQIPSCAMARREVYENSGGYRERMKRNEDAEFWCRTTSLGFRAKKVTQAVTYFHRERHDSKGAMEWATEGKEPDWTAWFPWRMGGTDNESARRILNTRGETPRNTHLVPFGAQGPAPKEQRFWYVHDYAYPVVSIVVTCGPNHEQFLVDALDSIQAQTYPDWECIVVNDTGKPWPKDIMGAPWAKVVNMDGNKGVSAARNEGFKHTRGNYVIWMDADDFWFPWTLMKMVTWSEHNPGRAIYSDFIEKLNEKDYKIFSYLDFEPRFLQDGCATPGSSVLIPRKWVDALVAKQGGWDENIIGMEDWDYQFALCDAGCCFVHVPEPLFVYRKYSTTKREKDYNNRAGIKSYIDEKWSKYRQEGKQLMCGCQKPIIQPTVDNAASLLSSSGNFSEASLKAVVEKGDPMQSVLLEYIGPLEQTFSVRSRVGAGVMYRFGNNDGNRIRPIFLGDLPFFMSLRDGEQPTYRVLGNAAVPPEAVDPASFLGAPITA